MQICHEKFLFKFFFQIWVMATGNRLKPEFCFLLEWKCELPQ